MKLPIRNIRRNEGIEGMAERKEYPNTEYIEGNAARQLNVFPMRTPRRYYEEDFEEDYELEEREQPQRYVEKKKKRNTRPLQRRKPGVDLVSFLFLTSAMLLTFFVCASYLNVQAEYTKITKNIASLESQILELKSVYEAKINAIDATLPLDYIYKVATEEYGMVHPEKDKIIKYETIQSDMVKQYGDIPEGTKKSLLDDILGNN